MTWNGWPAYVARCVRTWKRRAPDEGGDDDPDPEADEPSVGYPRDSHACDEEPPRDVERDREAEAVRVDSGPEWNAVGMGRTPRDYGRPAPRTTRTEICTAVSSDDRAVYGASIILPWPSHIATWSSPPGP